VQEALRRCPNQIVVLSPDSVKSDNVMDEVSYALEEHKQVIPVLYHECEMPFRLGRVQYIDFRVDYQRGLGDLLKALGVPEPAAPPSIQLSGTQTTPQPSAAPSDPSPGQAAGAQRAIESIEQERTFFSAPSPRERVIAALAGAVLGTITCLLSLKGQFWQVMSSEYYGVYYGAYPILAMAIAGLITGFRGFRLIAALAALTMANLGLGVGNVVWRATHHSAIESNLFGLMFGFTPGVILGALMGVVYLRVVSKRKS
jgi:hypothetical protein